MVTRFARVPYAYYAPSTCHMHPVHNCHQIKSCHRSVKQYITTHHYFSLVIPSPLQKYPCLPCSLPSLLPCSSIRSVAPSLPAPSFLRSLSPYFLSLAPSMPRFVPSSLVPFQAWYLCRVLTEWRRLLLTLPQPSLPTSTPAPSLSHSIASSLPPAPGFARVPYAYYAPSTCHMHPVHNCHHIKSCHRPVKQYITMHHNTEYIYQFTIFHL